MCGLAGFVDFSQRTSSADLRFIALQMASAIKHRGPDDEGVWTDSAIGLALSHRRLAILDLSPEGHQPMQSASSRYVLVFNGEIYNFAFLRKELETFGHGFHGHSDTEVMLAAFEQWGVEAAVRRFNGMFAFALYDQKAHILYLARDRVGEKPLYYGWSGDLFLFGSELKALRAHPNFCGEIDRNALALMMRHSYVPAPYSIYKDVCKLLPGTILQVPLASKPGAKTATPRRYWSAKAVFERGAERPFTGDPERAVRKLTGLLSESIALRMVADVPVGAFLSGGIDSSVVTALMQAQSARPVRTYTIGFTDRRYNEAVYAKAIAAHLGTEHTELYVTPKQTMAVIPNLPTLYDEPFSDSSQIPTFLVAQLARTHVTVALSGDGGDELFYGYERYFKTHDLWDKIKWLPARARRACGTMLEKMPQETIGKGVAAFLQGYGPRSAREKLEKLTAILNLEGSEALYLRSVSHWKIASGVVKDAIEPPTLLTDRAQWARLPGFAQQMMYFDVLSYLPDDILTKVDRAAMAVGLETRIPLLDHRIVQFAARIPMTMKIRDRKGKWLLRQVLSQFIPQRLIDRSKMGFSVPISHWLRGPLRGWAESLLSESRLASEGFFNPREVRRKWHEYVTGKQHWEHDLWDVLMFQAWLEQQRHHSITLEQDVDRAGAAVYGAR